MQGYMRSYVAPDTVWDRIYSGHPVTAVFMRLLPLILLGATMPLAFVVPAMAPFADYALVFLPAFTALVNGPIATAAATLAVVAIVSCGGEALGVLPIRSPPGATCRRSSPSGCCARSWRGRGTGSWCGCWT
nr:hypothetical protein GCM10025732_40680 [Glycomyces mayteni]